METEWYFPSIVAAKSDSRDTLRGNGQPPEPVWVSNALGPQEPSLLSSPGLLYALQDNGCCCCSLPTVGPLPGAAGRRVPMRHRLPATGTFT